MAMVEALKTDFARRLDAIGLAEGLLVGDWSAQVGTGGYSVGTPEIADPVDSTMQSLIAPLGGLRPLGTEVLGGASAAVTLVGIDAPGFVVVTGLAGLPEDAVGRWLLLSGSLDPNINGTWFVSRFIDPTSVEVYAPLALAGDAGPLVWSFRTAVTLRPNSRSTDFHLRLAAPDATVDTNQLGEVGVWGRVLRAPSEPGLVGTPVLYAVAHHAARTKVASMVLNYHVCTQF